MEDPGPSEPHSFPGAHPPSPFIRNIDLHLCAPPDLASALRYLGTNIHCPLRGPDPACSARDDRGFPPPATARPAVLQLLPVLAVCFLCSCQPARPNVCGDMVTHLGPAWHSGSGSSSGPQGLRTGSYTTSGPFPLLDLPLVLHLPQPADLPGNFGSALTVGTSCPHLPLSQVLTVDARNHGESWPRHELRRP